MKRKISISLFLSRSTSNSNTDQKANLIFRIPSKKNMSRFLVLNFEDFGLNQDISKTIQPFNPFCMCCLDREGPMFNLEKCQHKDYLNAFDELELKQINPLVCLQCHSLLKKIKCFQQQILKNYEILASEAFTDNTINNKKLSRLSIQKVVDDLHLPPDEPDNVDCNIVGEDNENSIEDILTRQIQESHENVADNGKGELILEETVTCELPKYPNINEDFTHNLTHHTKENFTHDILTGPVGEHFDENKSTGSNIVENYAERLPISSNLEGNFTLGLSNCSNVEENRIYEQNKLHKNIKTALDILERNNQSFVTLGSQLQFLNGEHLSFLESSLLSKEILSDIPLVSAKSLVTDLDNGLLNNTKSLDIEIDGTDKMFLDSLDLSPDLNGKETSTSDIIEIVSPLTNGETEQKRITIIKPKKKAETKVRRIHRRLQIKTVKLSQDELNRERVLQAQSDAYLRYKFRCETCIVGFNYKENLEDHTKRKHGPMVDGNVVCDICSQVIPTPGSVTQHLYRHYVRYECVQCKRRYRTHDEAIRHSIRNRCSGGNDTANRNLKMKPMSKRVKLKSK